MRTPDYHDPLTCSDLKLNQERLSREYTYALSQLSRVLSHYFGSVQGHLALKQGLEHALELTLYAFAQEIANVISAAYVSEALSRSREATANMFEALAAGAHVAHKGGRACEDTGEVAHVFAAIAACEGRPKILNLDSVATPDECLT